MLIGIHGKKGSGKSTMASYIKTLFSINEYAFADPLKRICSELYGVPVNFFYEERHKETVIPEWGMSPRTMMTTLDDYLKAGSSKDCFVRLAEKRLKKEHGSLLLSDIRYDREAEWVHSHGGLVLHLLRPETDGDAGMDESELGISPHLIHATILNDGDRSTLHGKIKSTLCELGLSPENTVSIHYE